MKAGVTYINRRTQMYIIALIALASLNIGLWALNGVIGASKPYEPNENVTQVIPAEQEDDSDEADKGATDDKSDQAKQEQAGQAEGQTSDERQAPAASEEDIGKDSEKTLVAETLRSAPATSGRGDDDYDQMADAFISWANVRGIEIGRNQISVGNPDVADARTAYVTVAGTDRWAELYHEDGAWHAATLVEPVAGVNATAEEVAQYEREQSGTSSSSSSSSDSSSSSSASNGSSSSSNEAVTVYWSDDGHTYHYDRNCEDLKKAGNVYEGSVSRAKNLDYTRACSKCSKSRNTSSSNNGNNSNSGNSNGNGPVTTITETVVVEEGD